MGCCGSSVKEASAPPNAGGTTQDGHTAAPPPPAASPEVASTGPLPFAEDTRDCYRIKDITFFGSPRRILLQSANGPCPLLALCNVLLLRNQLHITQDARYISFTECIEMVSNVIFDANARATAGDSPQRSSSGMSNGANVRENVNACLEILPRLNEGLDVNCKFAGPSQFECTQELAVFDLLDIGLLHGWVVSKEDAKAHAAIAHLSYNQLVEKVIAFREAECATGADPKIIEEGRHITEFMDSTASQLTYDGLTALHTEVRERQLVVFFRNSHFSTMVRYNGELYLLCTDHGFAATHVVWERLDEINGDTTYCDAGFQASTAANGDAAALAAALAAQEQVLATDFQSGGAVLIPTDAVGGQSMDQLELMQMLQLQAGESSVGQGTGNVEMDADAMLAMQLMQEDLRQADQNFPNRA